MNTKQPLSVLTFAVGLALCGAAQADELPQLTIGSSAENTISAANDVLPMQATVAVTSTLPLTQAAHSLTQAHAAGVASSTSFALAKETTQDMSVSASPDLLKPADSSGLVAINDGTATITQSNGDAQSEPTRHTMRASLVSEAAPESASTTIVDRVMTTDVAEPQPAKATDVKEVATEAADASTDVATDATAEATTDAADVMDEEFADPYERMNRNVYAFNDAVDKAAVKPVAKGYQKVIPKGLRLCASNMFSNLGEPYTAANNLLQGKPKSMLQDIGRLLLNSTLGIGGCIDVASAWGIPKHQEDFGQTLAVWGVPSGPYVVLPVLGPSTVRDALSKPVDFLANPIGYVTNVPLRNSLQGYKMLDTRTNLLEASDVVDQSALDPYVMLRDAWLQRRLAQIKDDDGSYNDSNDVPRKLELAPRSAVIQ